MGRNENKEVVGFSSTINLGNLTDYYSCTTSGNNVVSLAHTLTGRLNPRGVAIGSMTPNVIVHPGRNSGASETLGAGVLNRGYCTSSVTRLITFLTSSGTEFVANRACIYSNNHSLSVGKASWGRNGTCE